MPWSTLSGADQANRKQAARRKDKKSSRPGPTRVRLFISSFRKCSKPKAILPNDKEANQKDPRHSLQA